MFSHITLGTNDIFKSEKFYDSIMTILGHPKIISQDGGAAYGDFAGQMVFIGPAYDKNPAVAGNGVHTAFLSKTRAQVDKFYAAALENGGTCEGPPGIRTYHPNYYGAYVRDPDGNKIQAVCHSKNG